MAMAAVPSAEGTPAGREVFAEGLLELLQPAVQQLDSHVHTVRESQVDLREHIDSLATELCRINDEQKVALDLDPYVKKLLNARRRVVLVNNILQNAQVTRLTPVPVFGPPRSPVVYGSSVLSTLRQRIDNPGVRERLRRLNHNVGKEAARRKAILESGGVYPPGSPSK